MSTAATQQQPPAIPPRPSRGSQDRERSELPKIPPRPTKRGPSPNPDRYAPSPLNGGLLSPTKKDQRSNSNGDPIDRSRSVDLPAVVGEEGMEYAALAEELASSREPSTSPTQTRAVDENMKIYAPTATMPASRAKQRIMQVTRTDSDNAAAFGIGKPSQDGATPSNRSLKKKASTASGEGHSEIEDEEHGIPEIGQQIPLLKHAGDVQAPSPAPGSDAVKAHKRKGSSRGLPPGSYGLHGHNVAPQDKLDKEYYQKHPELLRREHHPYQADRPTDFALSSEQLNKLVRETESTGHGVGEWTRKSLFFRGEMLMHDQAQMSTWVDPVNKLAGPHLMLPRGLNQQNPERKRFISKSPTAGGASCSVVTLFLHHCPRRVLNTRRPSWPKTR